MLVPSGGRGPATPPVRLEPTPALIVQFADGLAELLARCDQPELAAQLLAGAAQQRLQQQQGANRLVQAAAERAWHRVHPQLDAATLQACTGQGQRYSAEALRQVALSGLASAGARPGAPPFA